MLAAARQPTSLVGAALTGVTIAFAPEESTRRGDLEAVATDIGRSEGVTVRHPMIAAQVWGLLSPDYIPGDYYKESTGRGGGGGSQMLHGVNPAAQFASCCCDKHHSQKQLGQGRVYFTFHIPITAHHEGKSVQEPRGRH